ncbi:MAG: VanZ family protein [Pseudomonadota bacterium]
MNLKEEKALYGQRWRITLLYTLSIFALLPVFPLIWSPLSQAFPQVIKGFIKWSIPACVLFFLAYASLFRKERDILFYGWSSLFLFSFFVLLYFFCKYPAEPFHIVEYGLLVLLLYRTLKLRIRNAFIYLIILLYTLGAGLLDEIIQGILPNRNYEFRDVLLNWISAFLGTGLLAGFTWKGFAGVAQVRKIRRWSMVLLSMMLISHGILFYHTYRKPPLNVILLTVDTFRPDHLGCYGYGRDTTPFLDRLARKGVIFKNVIASAPWTSPGLISIFTGLYPSEHGVQARGQNLLSSTPTLFKIGKQHGYKIPNISYLADIDNFANLGLDPKEPRYFQEAEEPGDELLRWLDDHHGDRFLTWYHYRFLHLPYKPMEGYNLYLTEDMKECLESIANQTVQKESVIPRGTVTFTARDRETVVALYDGQLRELDHFLRRLVERMARWKLHKNTLLVITADHGEELFEHGFIGHASTAINATLYDEVLKIPLILYGPSAFKGGRVVKDQIRQIDIMPTILNIAGLPVPDSIGGQSLMPWIEGKGGKRPLPALSESVSGGYQSSSQQEKIMLRSIRTDDWKLICTEGGERDLCRLFNLREDPGETEDLMAMEKETAVRLKTMLQRHVSQMQTKWLAMVSKERARFSIEDIPKEAELERPIILSPRDQETIRLREKAQLTLRWTGDKNLAYVIEYDVGRGWRNLKGSLPVHGTEKVFGPLPREAWEPLPYWNPYRIRISPYGLEKYWSPWVEFFIMDQ